MAIGVLKTKEDIVADNIKGLLKELMGDDYVKQLAKRAMLNKNDPVIKHLQDIEKILGTGVFRDYY